MTLYFDQRWIGLHGIGRFAGEVAARCAMSPIAVGGRPLDLLDPVRLRHYLASIKPRHFFSPGFNAPLGKPCEFSLTVHDLIHLDVAEERSTAKALYYARVVKPALFNAKVVFTVSEYSRQRIVAWAGVETAKVVCVGNGVAPAFSANGPKWRHDRPYVLYVGNQKPHKNVQGLVEAFAASRLRGDFDLLLTGRLSEPVARAVGRSGLVARVKPLGSVSEESLPALYRGAYALVMPSRHEGFGLPVVEAMACGTPVLSSNRTSLPEVGGDAAVYFDPDDIESFVDALNSLADTALSDRLRLAGLERAKRFDWDEVARRVAVAISC